MMADTFGPRVERRMPRPDGETILLVEDDAAVREFVAAVLKRDGYSVLKARHSAEALAFNFEFPGTIDLLLTDLCMPPHINGRCLAQAIRESRPGIPVLYISGYVDDSQVEKELIAGLSRFLPKPFSPDALSSCVRQALLRPAASA